MSADTTATSDNINNNNNSVDHVDNMPTAKRTRNWPKSPFPVDDKINRRIVLADKLDSQLTEAIVNPTDENLSSIHPSIQNAGKELKNHLQTSLRFCPTGGVRLSPGFRTGHKYILHAVPPKYQPKYKTAAETALFHTYFRILEIMIEQKINSIVMLPLKTAKCNLPGADNANMHLKIVRRMLEKKMSKCIEKIIILVPDDPDLYADYLDYFTAYFPRSAEDEEDACYKLDFALGGPNGEPMIPGREIRIVKRPICHDASVDLKSGLDLSVAVGRSPFGQMMSDIDKIKANAMLNNNNNNNRGEIKTALAKPSFFKPRSSTKSAFKSFCSLI